MDKELINSRIAQEEDYIRCPKCGNSLNKFLAKHSNGVDNKTIARLLMLTEEKVEQAYQEAIEMLRKEMTDVTD